MTWHQLIIKIDLSTGIITKPKLSKSVLGNFIGGKGLGTYLLHKYMDPLLDPLDPQSVLVLSTGPAQGVMPIAGRYVIVTKSPLSGIYIDSHVGGFVGPELRFAGYDAVVVTGKASEPSVIVIKDDEISIEPAGAIWGDNTLDTEDKLKEKYPDSKTISIGPAGENMVHYATTTSDYYRTAGRGGIGMIFGSKLLKAIVIRGTGSIDVHSPDKVAEIKREITQRAKQSKLNGHQLPKLGTSWLVSLSSARDQLPTMNYQRGEWERSDEIEGSSIEAAYSGKLQKKPCYKCSLSCAYVIDSDYEWANGRMIQHPEYESLALLGSNLGTSNLETILHTNHLCNTYGLDTISAGSTISWFMECKQRDAIPDEYLSEAIEFGDEEGIIALITKIANKKGVGKVLALGVKRAAEIFGNGSDQWAVHVRGLELPAWDPRGKLGMGLSYITSNVGGSHLRGWPSTADYPDKSVIPIIDSLIEQQDLKIIKDSLIMCHFTHSINPAFGFEDSAKMYEALTGIPSTVESMRAMAHNIWLLSREFNVQIWNGEAPRKTDILPPRLMNDPLPSGIAKGLTSFKSQEDMEEGLNLFYKKRNCTPDGIPSREEIDKINKLMI